MVPAPRGGRGGRGRGAGGRGRGAGRGGRGRGRGGRGPLVRRRRPNLPPDLNAPVQRGRYYNILANMMEYLNNRTYPDDKVFTAQELGAVTPEDIHRWMCFKVYGTPTPAQDAQPQLRSTTVSYWKKAISYFMPDHASWNDAVRAGNPTKAKLINRLHKAVIKAETRGIGQPTRANRPFTSGEFVQIIDLMGNYSGASVVDRKKFQAWLKLQYHIIGRADDISHLKKNVLEPSTQFPGRLTVKMRWSKNVQDERDCPKQIIMGAMNSKYCVELALALYLEKWIGDGDGAVSQWVFANGRSTAQDETDIQDKDAINIKNQFSRFLGKAVLSNVEFNQEVAGNLGTHSIRKIATTVVRQRGCTKDDADYRGRWKMSKRMQDNYTDVQLLWPDVLAGSKLCQGGVAKYKLKEGIGITDHWLATEICPNIAGSFDNTVAAILAKPLVWACYEPSTIEEVPVDLYARVTTKIGALNLESVNFEAGENPIKKVEIIPSQTDGNVDMDEIPADDDEEVLNAADALVAVAGGGGGGGGGFRRDREMRARVYAKVRTISERVVAMQHHEVTEFADMKRRMKKLERMIHAISVSPARVVGAATTRRGTPIRIGTAPPPDDPRPATLSRAPRTLHALWDEWMNGIGGRKPARLFTLRERGACKHLYSKRRKFWSCVERMLDGGTTLLVAIRRIYGVYGYLSVTDILKKLGRDESNGGHARLQAVAVSRS